MGKTYTQYITDVHKKPFLPQKALIMAHFILYGEVHSAKELAKALVLSRDQIYQVVFALKQSGYLEQEAVGVYRITRKGLRIWEKTLNRHFTEVA